jgi:hypothetical protein
MTKEVDLQNKQHKKKLLLVFIENLSFMDGRSSAHSIRRKGGLMKTQMNITHRDKKTSSTNIINPTKEHRGSRYCSLFNHAGQCCIATRS